MFVYLEDHQFYTHHGIDLEAVRTAYERNKRAGTLAFGGSTITQQLTRTLFLTPHKNYLRKYLEALLSLELDLLLPKDRIMELYLNHIEWGSGIFGVGTAAKKLFPPARGEALSRSVSPARDDHSESAGLLGLQFRTPLRDAAALRFPPPGLHFLTKNDVPRTN